jgi:hypothetical protein
MVDFCRRKLVRNVCVYISCKNAKQSRVCYSYFSSGRRLLPSSVTCTNVTRIGRAVDWRSLDQDEKDHLMTTSS